MDGVVSVITNPTVSVRLTSTLSSFEANRRFNRGITVAEFKSKLEMVVGSPASCMDLQLFSASDKFLQKMEDNEALLGSYPVDDDCRIHVTDRSGAQIGEFSDLSKVEKYEIPDDVYEKRTDSVRSFLKKKKVGQFDEEKMVQRETEKTERELEEKATAEAIVVGNRCQVLVSGQPTKIGTVMFVGTADFKPGYWVGVKYDEPLGKNDGSVNGKQYFECQPKYGAFVKPQTVTVGDFPEEDYGLDEIALRNRMMNATQLQAHLREVRGTQVSQMMAANDVGDVKESAMHQPLLSPDDPLVVAVLQCGQNLNDLRAALQEEWDAMPQQTISRLVNSMRRRCQAVSSNGAAGGEQAVQTVPAALDPQQPQPQQQPPPNAWQVIKGVLFRIFIIWAISSFFRRSPATPEQSGPAGAPRLPSRNLFPKDTLMDMHVFVTQNEHFSEFNESEALFWYQRDLVYGDWVTGDNGDGCYEQYQEMDIPEVGGAGGGGRRAVIGSLVIPQRKGEYRRLATVHASRMLNKFKRRKFQKTKNLLTGETEVDPEIIKRKAMVLCEVISHWHPNLTINMVDDHTAWVKGSVPPTSGSTSEYGWCFEGERQLAAAPGMLNLMRRTTTPVNDTLKKLPLRLSFCPLSLWRWQLYAAQNAKSPWNFLADETYEQSDDDQDSVKVALLETNPYLLGVTIVVSIVHSIFEFLAFKNDIQFWNSRQSLEGLSVRSIFFGVFQSLVVLLYILDNETNFVVQVSVFIGLLIDFWKITKVMDVKLDRENKLAGIFPRLVLKDKSTYVQSSTKIYDDMAFRYLSWLLYPLFGCYAVYSLLYVEHKGWYSWVLSMMYGFLLTFGFITMTPQLFINYKMKSVAHLPWRMLTYKALNTFIDDLFAFVIRMPMMYRIGCLRDDVVFFIYLYQRWIYRVDLNRVNEFGTSGAEPHKDSSEQGAESGEPVAETSPRGDDLLRRGRVSLAGEENGAPVFYISELDLIQEFLTEDTIREQAILPRKLPGPPPPPEQEMQDQNLVTKPRHAVPVQLVARGTAPQVPFSRSQVSVNANGMALPYSNLGGLEGLSRRTRGVERGRGAVPVMAGSATQQGQSGTESLERLLEKPVLEIVEQPKERGMRFRYECEGRSAGSILGASSTDPNKTLPTIEIKGCKPKIKRVKITVSLVTKDIPHRPHPHSLVGKDCADGICVVRLNPCKSCRHSFSNLGIQCVRRKELEMALEKRRNQNIDPFNTGHSKSIEDIDMNVVRLCFQCELETDNEERTLLSPVVSNAIYDKKATTTSELKINRLNVVRGPCTGKTEIYLLCDKVQKDDIEIIFSLGKWEAKAEFAQTDVHRQIAIVFKSPPYQEQDIREEVDVNVFLRRLSDHMDSEPLKFTYEPQNPDPYEVNRKRKLKSDIKFGDRCSVAAQSVTLPESPPSLPFAPLPFVLSNGPQPELLGLAQDLEAIDYPSTPLDVKLEENISQEMLESPEFQAILKGILDGSSTAADFHEQGSQHCYGLHSTGLPATFNQDLNSNYSQQGIDFNFNMAVDFYNDVRINPYGNQLVNSTQSHPQPVDPLAEGLDDRSLQPLRPCNNEDPALCPLVKTESHIDL
ncbi:hypothetical protein SKAU_G00090200 [Synaphobranchus kaupii]|uniref:Uncharacterized protein n=1 Tax=Synaphobranchus kaupii TaxID=118154 RepID=A0A9Q1FX06_SYNKA|nr:hypothetical protein SKAU_G00090200 [Synaphobranchus kaupii]